MIDYVALLNIKTDLEKESDNTDNDIRRVADYLLNEIQFDFVPRWRNEKIIIITPDLSTFNRLVRERLCKSDIYFETFI